MMLRALKAIVKFGGNCALILIGVWIAISNGIVAAQIDESTRKWAGRFPAESLLVVRANDASALLRAFEATDWAAALNATPGAQLAAFALHEVGADPSLETRTDFNKQSETPIEWMSRLLDGPIEFCLLPGDTSSPWLLEAGLNSDHPFVNQSLAKLNRANTMEDWGLEKIELEDKGAVGLHDARTSLFFRFSAEQLVVSNDRTLFFLWSKEKGLAAERSLSEVRKFQQVAVQNEFGSVGNSVAILYADVAGIMSKVISALRLDPKDKELLRKIGVTEILALAGTIAFGTKRADENADLETNLFLLQGFPKDGINGIFRFETLEKPVNADVPIDVDFCFSSRLNIVEMLSNVTPLNGVLSPFIGTEHPVNESITDIVPLIGTLLFKDKESVENFTGDFDWFGTVKDRIGAYSVLEVESVSRLHTNNLQGVEEMQKLLQSIPEMQRLIRHDRGDCRYWTVSDEEHQQFMEALQERRRENPEFPLILKERQAFVGTNSYIAILTHESRLADLLTKQNDLLQDDAGLKRLWNYLSERKQCGAFLFVRGPELIRPAIPVLHRRFVLPTFSMGARLKELKKQGKHTSIEYRICQEACRTSAEWSLDDFKRHFGPGGLAIYETENGIHCRIAQLKKHAAKAAD